MCIACELGYWSMLDAIEQERRALRERNGMPGETGLACETLSEPLGSKMQSQSSQEPRRE